MLVYETRLTKYWFMKRVSENTGFLKVSFLMFLSQHSPEKNNALILHNTCIIQCFSWGSPQTLEPYTPSRTSNFRLHSHRDDSNTAAVVKFTVYSLFVFYKMAKLTEFTAFPFCLLFCYAIRGKISSLKNNVHITKIMKK